jgi:probable phosphoglycerate mutase
MSLQLWVVRHGSTAWSDAGRLNGWTDVPLNERGRGQAATLARSLSESTFAGVWTSDLRRSMETARLVRPDAVPDPRLRELDFGAFEGKSWEGIPNEGRRALARFDGFHAPGGESLADLRSRVLLFVGSLPEGRHLVFTHGGVIRLLLREVGEDSSVAPGGLVRLNEIRGSVIEPMGSPAASPGSGPRPTRR